MNTMIKLLAGLCCVIALSMSGCIDHVTMDSNGTVTIDPAKSATGTVNVQTVQSSPVDVEANSTSVELEPAVENVEKIEEPVVIEPVTDNESESVENETTIEPTNETDLETVEEDMINDTEVAEGISNATVIDEDLGEALEDVETVEDTEEGTEENVTVEESNAEPEIDSDGNVVETPVEGTVTAEEPVIV